MSSEKQDRRQRYLAVARTLFADHGYAGTSTDMIVAEAGGSKATLYKYFPSKQSLITGLIEQVISHMNRDHPSGQLTGLPLREALTRIARSALEGIVSETAQEVLRLCVGEYRRFPELARTVWDNGPAVTYANFRRFIEDRKARGELDFDDAQLAAEHFIAGTVGHIQLKVALGIAPPPDDEEMRRRVEAVVETFLARYGTGR